MATEPEDQPECEGMELVMPFVVVTSKGGPFDDDAFTAGWAAAEIDGTLATAERIGATEVKFEVFRTALLKQVDLIAMRYGFASVVVEASEEWPEWGVLTVRRERPDGD